MVKTKKVLNALLGRKRKGGRQRLCRKDNEKENAKAFWIVEPDDCSPLGRDKLRTFHEEAKVMMNISPMRILYWINRVVIVA